MKTVSVCRERRAQDKITGTDNAMYIIFIEFGVQRPIVLKLL